MSEAEGTLLNDRYRLDAEIGRGGMGVVYCAHDTILQRDVAVKVLSAASLDDESRARLLREAQAAAQLNHPNIASVHDAGETEGVPYIVMELVQGASLHDRPPGDIDEVVDIAAQICAALEHAHDQGIIHRDLKPENVLLAPDGSAKLVDFGLARTVSSRLTTGGAILGTIRYISPEQAQGGDIDGRTDLYALGVMLYEWTAGRSPFKDGPPAVILSQHLYTAVVPPSEYNGEIPPALDALIVRLMAKRPEDRPTSAHEVRLALEAIARGAAPAAGTPDRAILPGFLRDDGAEEPPRTAFVARERELAWLIERLDDALAGTGQVAFVTGGPGRGKTALVDAFARQAMDDHPELLVASGTCNAYSGVGDPYLPFREVLGMLTGDVEAGWASGAVSREHARRLWQALPAAVGALLDSGPHVVPALVPGEPLLDRATAACPGAPWLEQLGERVGGVGEGSAAAQLEQSHLFQQVSNVLHAVAEEQPLLLILDDLQWVDRTSAGLLFHLGRRLEGRRILILGAYRPEEVAFGVEDERHDDRRRHPLEKLLAEFKRLYGDVWLDLVDAGEDDGRRFVDALLETEPNALGDAFRQALAEQAQGHPLFTVELLRAMQERGDLVRDEAGRWVEGPALDWEKMPARVEGVIAERIERLGNEQREILTVASVEGEDFTAEVVGRVRAIERRDLVLRLSGELHREHRLVRARGLQRLETGRLSLYRFQHHLFQKYLYSRLDTVERACLHEDVGNALEALYGEQTDEVAVQLARHFLEAGVSDRAAHYLGRAGELAAERYANEEAVAHLNRALEVAPGVDRSERFTLHLARSKVYGLIGRRDAQLTDLCTLETLAEELGPKRQAEAAGLRARYAIETNDVPSAFAAAQVSTQRAREAGHTGLQAQGHLEWGVAYIVRGDLAAAVRQYDTALRIARDAGLQEVEASALYHLARVWRDRDDAEAARDCIERALHLYRKAGDQMGESIALWEYGIFLAGQGAFTAAWETFEQAQILAEKLGDRRGEMYAYYGLGLVSQFVGFGTHTRTQLEKALPIAREVLDRSCETAVLCNLADVACDRRDYAVARQYAGQALELAREIGEADAMVLSQTSHGRVHLALGHPTRAEDHYEQALAVYRQSGEMHYAMEILADLAVVKLSQGELRQAQARVGEILSYLDEGNTLSTFGMPFFVYLVCYQVLEAAGDPRAPEILETAYSMLVEHADRIEDDEMRWSFLSNVSWNREIMELAERAFPA